MSIKSLLMNKTFDLKSIKLEIQSEVKKLREKHFHVEEKQLKKTGSTNGNLNEMSSKQFVGYTSSI